MDVVDPLYVATRAEWRAWLAAHHATRRDVWLVAYRRATGRPSVAYADAVEEALCVGWIDSTRKALDADRYAQRYTPRRPGSPYSQTNLERLARLLALDAVLPSVRATVEGLRPEAFVVADDIRAALRADAAAWAFWEAAPAPYRRIRAAYVETARARPEEFAKRLRHLVARSARGEHFGYGIEAFYG